MKLNKQDRQTTTNQLWMPTRDGKFFGVVQGSTIGPFTTKQAAMTAALKAR